MISCPLEAHWQWFGETPSKELADAVRNSHSPFWGQQAYRWFYDRLPTSVKTDFRPPRDVAPVGPPCRFVPFPASISSSSDRNRTFDAGVLAFLSVDSSGSPDAGNTRDENDSILRNAHDAAAYVFELFRNFHPRVGFPNVEIVAPNADGGSLALSAMIAALCRILRITCPDSILATGCWEREVEKLRPVGVETLLQKITVAVRYGYTKFFLVEGQRGTWSGGTLTPRELLETLREAGILPRDAELDFVEVPAEPYRALFRVLRELPRGADAQMAILLATFEKRFLRSGYNGRHDVVFDVVSPFATSESPLVRHVALDILCRRELHLGHTQRAEEFRRQTPPLAPSDFPSGSLGGYLKYEETASKAILDLDLGLWNSELPDHQLLDRLLNRLSGNIDDHLADLEDLRNALALANTKGRRLMFLGRLNDDAELLERAWKLFTKFYDFWNEIFEYTQQANRIDEIPQRQWNQCVECMADYHRLTGKVLSSPNLKWTHFVSQNAFDLISSLSWHIVHETLETSTLEQTLKEADAQYAVWKGYPNFLPYEKILAYDLGTESIRKHATSQLAQADHLQTPSQRSGILALLAMRTAFVLNDLELMRDIHHEILPCTPLRTIADRLLEEPEKIVLRCPY